jgi:hypothetical protein
MRQHQRLGAAVAAAAGEQFEGHGCGSGGEALAEGMPDDLSG